MRGHDEQTAHMFSYLSPEQRVPADHPLRAVRALTDEALQTMSRRFASLYATTGRPSTPPEQLLRALLLQVLYTVRSERLLMEELNDNLLFRWFVGLNMDDPVWHPTTFTKNRDRLLSGDVAAAFFDAVQAHARAAGLLSDEHFTGDGTQWEAWASLKSFRCVDAAESDPPEDPGNPTVNFHGERRRNDTHQSTTDPEAMLHRKGKGKEAKLAYLGHVLLDNRQGLVANVCATHATGTAERDAAVLLLEASASPGSTVGADKGYDVARFVADVRVQDVTPHVAQKVRGSAIDGRTTRPAGYHVSQCLGAQLAISVNNCPPPRDPRSRMTSFKRTQRKYVQKAYRVRNWREYETGLRARGSLTVWLGLTDGKLANWNSPRPTRRKPGRQRKYSNHAIETTVTLGLVFGLASRQTEGFLRSLLTLLNLDNDVPDHSTISRRMARLGKVASYERRTVKPVHLLIDSSGLSVHVGQLRTSPKARDYRKLHLAVDEQTSDVVACELTSKRARDASRVASLVGQIERPIASAKADAAYDTGDVYKTLENHRAHRSPKVLIPPRKGAQLALDSAGTRQRNRNIRARSRVGKRKWYVASGYSRRSKVETTFHRYKAILGSAMRARGLASQRVEVRLGCKILNTMTALGIPDGEMIG